MVNEKDSTKKIVLDFLRSQNTVFSGEKIAEKLNISRVSVWKAVKTLCENGYGIKCLKNGYILENDKKDSLNPWEFGDKESLVDYFSETESTMIDAWKIAESGKLNSGDIRIVTADRQTKGRGHENHSWKTLMDSLAFTLVCKEKVNVFESGRWMMASQIALVESLKKIAGRNFFVRWPNDIWSEKGKVSGILDEYKVTGGFSDFINIGIGVNISTKPDFENADFICSGEKSSPNQEKIRKSIIEEFISNFEETKKMLKDGDSSLEKKWNSLCYEKCLKNSLKIKNNFGEINSLGFARIGNELFIPGSYKLEK